MGFSIETHEEIAKWNQEAKKEDSTKYFYHIPEFELLKTGQRSFVISRKGTGKTAIAQKLIHSAGAGEVLPTEFAVALSFRNYPFNDLYKNLKDPSYRAHNQYISGWQFLIYCSLAKMMANDAAVPSRVSAILAHLFETDPAETLARRFSRWISGGIRFDIQGTGIEIKLARQIINGSTSFDERIQALKTLLLPALSRSKYFIIFDELDEDYTAMGSIEDRKEYFALLASLFKAVELVRDETKTNEACVLPIVLLRDDIFKKLLDSDRAKWASSAVRIDWPINKIKDLLGFRLSRAATINPTRSFKMIWPEIVGRSLHYTVNGRKWDKFDLIASYTLLRPRDFIFYISQCSQKILDRHNTGRGRSDLSGEILRESVREFAQHLKLEIEDEISGQLPYIGGVLDALLSEGERDFTGEEFRDIYNRERKKHHDIEWFADAESVLEILYNFSAIGFVRDRKDVFRYLSPSSDLDIGKRLLLHKGLFGARRV